MTALAVVLVAPACTKNATVDLVLVAGQSNAVGFDADPAALPPDDADKEILFWWRCGDPPPDEHDSTSGGQWKRLQAQPRGNATEANRSRPFFNFRSAAGGFGPELSLGRVLHHREGKPLAVLKTAWNGTDMQKDWKPGGNPGNAYHSLISEFRVATRAAKALGIDLRPRALVWLQGESDSTPAGVPLYAASLAATMRALRKDLDAPDLAVLVGVNMHFGDVTKVRGKMRTIVNAQKSVASEIGNAAYVDTSGVTLANKAHFDAAGTLEVGRRYGEALLELEARGRGGAVSPPPVGN